MEDTRTLTSSHRLATNFETLLQSQKADIITFPVLISESPPGSSSRDIPLSVQKLIYYREEEEVENCVQLVDTENELLPPSEDVLWTERTQEILKGWTPIYLKGKFQKTKAWLKNQSMLREYQKMYSNPVEAPQESTRNTPPPKVPNNKRKAPKTKNKGN
ncbi:hypothetical protein O181_018919 [Austropuccinia psidii MF-1]|uniref:Uncharacterized protein n=1 Tax=Austropuccinia psidii MF-1 TaxID=1389203 RepID=A0A9Q3C636_9BASI|nr:hypothetical protein [Austropuccinia psidii MF-1]